MGLNDTRAPAGVSSGDGLRVFQVRVHLGCWNEKPDAQKSCRLQSVILTLSKNIREREGLHGLDQVFEMPSIRAPIAFRVHFTVASDEGKAVGRGRIRPPPTWGEVLA